jgi:hypothetical protein
VTVYLATPADLDWHLDTSLERLLLQLLPLLIIVTFSELPPPGVLLGSAVIRPGRHGVRLRIGKWCAGLIAVSLVGAATISATEMPRPRRPTLPDWIGRYERLTDALPTTGSILYLNDPAVERSDKTGLFRAQYVVTPRILQYQTQTDSLFKSGSFRPVVVDFVKERDSRVPGTLAAVRKRALESGTVSQVHPLGALLFLVSTEEP